MLTMEQTITIPDDHRVFLDLPPVLPVGRTRVELTFTPISDERQEKKERIRLTKSMVDEMLQEETLLSLTGFLHTDMDAVEIRAERLREHDYTD